MSVTLLMPFLIITLASNLNFDLKGDSRPNNIHRVVFYNVENLFDCVNDSLTKDDEFTPEGELNWNEDRYKKKLNSIAKVIIAAGEWNFPLLIGLCEVENRMVLEDLIYTTPLKKKSIGILHYDSPDTRGIDAALLYDKSRFQILHSSRYQPPMNKNYGRNTRDILYACGVLQNKDTLHVFVNHWPSRFGGQLASEPSRINAALKLKQLCDSIFFEKPNAGIIIMGDFNDEPEDKSISEILQACNLVQENCQLYNLMTLLNKGTLFYAGTVPRWYTFDHLIVSQTLLKTDSSDSPKVFHWDVFDPHWLREPDTGRPYRTYKGPAYTGGFSDHFPVYLDIAN
ncbi:MAG: endonuclease/exonuclease/phosphatase family protein [Cyclobacteriaceae bacterium]|nr:endonuclease/exonuclease/phosphatase family protein [Cyclobacteriaceae bacterium]